MERETKIVRLTSHEELIAKVTVTGDVVHLEDPLILVPTSQKALALAPWMPYTTVAEDGIDIPLDRVVFIVTPHKELAKEHASAISGLIVPDKDVVGVVGNGLLTE